VIPIGGEVRQYRVTPNPAAMLTLGVTAAEIEAAIARFGTNSGGGFVDQQGSEYLIRNLGLTQRLEDLRGIPVAQRAGQWQPVLLHQVATVDFAARPRRGDAGYRGAPAVVVSIQKQPNADTVALTRVIEESLAEAQRSMPAGVRVTNVQFRQASFIEASINNLQMVLLEAAVVVAIILVLFLLDVRATAISLLAIPISVLVTVIVFQLLGLSINTMTLGGLAIAIGELVDDAVVDVENILRRLRENATRAVPQHWNLSLMAGHGLTGMEGNAIRTFNVTTFHSGGAGARPQQDGLSATPFPSGVRNVPIEITEAITPVIVWRKQVIQVVAAASQEVRSGIVYATMIVILVFVPLFALPGIEGRLFVPLGVAYVVAILASLVVSITVTPVLAYFLLAKRRVDPQHRDGVVLRVLKRGNRALLGWAFGHARLLCVLAGLGAGAAVVAAALLPRSFLPPFNEGTVLISLTFRPGISLAESSRVAAIAERLVAEVPEVDSVGRRTGRAELDEHAEGVHSSELDVALHRSGRARAEVLADIRDRLSVLPASVSIGQPIQHRLDHMLSGVRAEIAVKVFGLDFDTLTTLAEGLRARFARLPGLVDVLVEQQVRIPQLRITPDYDRAALYGIPPAAVVQALETLSNGRVVSQIVEGNRRFDVVMRLADLDRSTVGLAELLVPTPAGFIPLRLIATIEETDGPNQFLREGGQRRIFVSANTDGVRDPAAAVADMRQVIAESSLPEGYAVRIEGQSQAQEEAARTIGLLALVSLALVYVVLHARYRSTALALIVMGNIPLALIGSVVALWIAGQSLSVASMVGFITLAGISARNGILKISHYLNLALAEGQEFGHALVQRGSEERLAPVLMTALCAGLALVPLLFGADQPGREILHPVAVAIFGGLISATLLDAVLTPLLFLAFGRRPLERLRALQDETRAPGATRTVETY
ncbi:MAG: efflux RND transporter permease subunit, partial [Acetobacteraceae bacterium]|nr:efflux RND transporter permease subunit [Acetobacteraceae bacterium]